MDKKGIALVLSFIVIVVLIILGAALVSRSVFERASTRRHTESTQAFWLAEAGANYALVEFKNRIRGNVDAGGNPLGLVGRVKNNNPAFVYSNYSNSPLMFLRDFAYAAGGTQFTSSGVLTITDTNLSTGVSGGYTATITITANGNPSNPSGNTYIFPYSYQIEAVGNTPVAERTVKLSQGTFSITVTRNTFARFALFTNHHQTTGGTTVWFTENTNFTGPVHTNGYLAFANNPSGTFTQEVTQTNSTAYFYNNDRNNHIFLDADSNPPYDVPQFAGGFSRGVTAITLPSAVTQADLKSQATGGQDDLYWPNGIYLANQGGGLVGGIYVKGDASNLTMSVDASSRPVYTITQGSNSKKITVDYTANQTIVANLSGGGGTPAGTYSGIPNGVRNEGILIYNKGSISNFSGTVQADTKATVTSEGDISISDHIMYQNYHPGSAPDAVGYTNTLGILAWNGDVRISTSASNNLNIHGVVMAPGTGGVFTVDNYDSRYIGPRGIVTLLGGVITDYYGAFGQFSGTTQVSGYGRNFVYDARMLAGVTPPYFPYLANFTTSGDDTDANGVRDLDKKLVWEEAGF